MNQKMKRLNVELSSKLGENVFHIDDAPRDGTVIIGIYDFGRILILWKDDRSHPGGSPVSIDSGWVDEEMKYPIDEPLGWLETDDEW